MFARRSVGFWASSAIIIVAAALVSGCGNGQGASSPTVAPPAASTTTDPATVVASGPGTYTFSYMGASGSIDIPASASEPSLANFEAYRKKASAAPVTYLLAKIDNSNGTSSINMYSIVVVTDDGQQVTGTGVGGTISKWQEAFGTSDTKNYNAGVSLINDNNFYLQPGAKGNAILVADHPFSTVKRVFVYPAGGVDKVEATKAGT